MSRAFGGFAVPHCGTAKPLVHPNALRLSVDRLDQELNVQLRRAPGADAADAGDTVSVQQLGVPEKARQKYNKGCELLRKGEQKDYAPAAALLKQAAEVQPYSAEPYYLLGKMQLETGNTERAELALNQALKRDTSRIPEVHILLANVCLRLHQVAKVASELRAYLAAAPQGLYAKAAREDLSKLGQQETAQLPSQS